MIIVRLFFVLTLALSGPYGLAAFVELDPDPRHWFWVTRVVLALVFAAYLFLLLSVLTEPSNRKAPARP